MFFCGVTVFGLAAFSAPSRATFWDVSFDPVDLVGVATLDISDPCLANNGTIFVPFFIPGCTISLTSADISLFNVNPPFALISHTIYEAESNPQFLAAIRVTGNELTGLATFPFFPIRLEVAGVPDEPHTGGREECDSTIAFTFPNGDQPLGGVRFFDCAQGFSTATITSISRASPQTTPEPGTLALLGGAVAAIWGLRRRKPRLV
jgi:hypothetical protein